MGGRPGGGQVDGLLIGIDEETGEKVPCTDHAELCRHVQDELGKLGCEKGDGPTAHASTAAFHRVLFHTRVEWRGNTA
eukprot:5204972-Prymnesium_polylepis.1